MDDWLELCCEVHCIESGELWCLPGIWGRVLVRSTSVPSFRIQPSILSQMFVLVALVGLRVCMSREGLDGRGRLGYN